MHENLSRLPPVASSSNRSFGWVFVGAFLILAVWPLVSGGGLRIWSLVVSAVVLLVTITVPALLTLPNRLWTRFGALLHRVASPIVLGIMFYAVITPMGALMRVLGKDMLKLRRDAAAESYWIDRDPPGPAPESLPHQF